MSSEQPSRPRPTTDSGWAHDAFVSHASPDRDAVEELISQLEKRDVRCWLASRNLRPAQDFSQGIIDSISRSKTVVLVISAASVASDYVRAEVKYARDQRKKIITVRLEDVELGALGLFVSLNHHIDLFESPRDAQYARVATAVLSDENVPGTLAARSRLPRWAKPMIAPVGSAVLVLAAIFGVQTCQMRSAMQQARQAVPDLKKIKEQMEAEQKRQLEQAGVDTGPSVEFNDWGRSGVQLNVRQLPRNMLPFYTVDGRELVEFQRRMTFMPTDGGKFTLVLKDAAGNEVERLDRTAQFAAAMKQSIEESVTKRLEEKNEWGCDVYGCRFQEYSQNPVMCSAYGKQVGFGAATSRIGDFKAIATSCTSNTGTMCVSASDLSFPLRPGSKIFTEITLLNDDKVELELPVAMSMTMRSTELTQESSTDHWLELKPVVDRNPPGRAPFAAVRYIPPDAAVGSFNVLFGVDACDSEQARLMADTDGRGLVEAISPYRSSPLPVYYSPGQGQKRLNDAALAIGPDTKLIGLAVEHGDGRTTGPYWYSFNAAKVAEHTGAPGAEPQIVCQGGGNDYISQDFRVCRAANPLAWSKVKAVKLGPEQNSLSHEIKVRFSGDEYLRTDCRVDLDRCPPFLFHIPKGWTDVFSAIVTTDGKTQRVARHVLPQR